MRYSLISRSAGVTRHRILRSPDFPRKNALRRSLRDRPFGSSFFLFRNEKRKRRRPNATLPLSLRLYPRTRSFQRRALDFFHFLAVVEPIFPKPRPTGQNRQNASAKQAKRPTPKTQNRAVLQQPQRLQQPKPPKQPKNAPKSNRSTLNELK